MPDTPVLAAFYAAYNAHDAQAAAALYTPDGRHEEIAMAKTRAGHAALAEGLEGFFRMLPDVHWQPGAVIRSADWLAVSYRMTGSFTPRPNEADPAPAPRAVALDGLHLVQLRDGAIGCTRDYWDKDAFLAQIR
ncbi:MULTISPECIES: nuclear transport factor 2 family protein [Actibacterium]|uniref:Putative ester cyclase n=1 Tax=Actibacterium naphthalenivorans TaxID=1614693 RepID=A0A840CFG0_9RHOB|nr:MULTISPECIES: nuclear transport factor 2 family protein [Actibacterium]MBB4022852.1 putative ester cyclase [Actibacterium naphthalenivorans]